jgi:hypothetical protein
MTLKTDMITDMATFFNTGEFAEAVTYTPSGGSPVSRNAIVDREGLQEAGHFPGFQSAIIRMFIASDSTYGVNAVTYGDTVSITNPAGTAQTWYVHPELEAVERDGVWELFLTRDSRPDLGL